MEDCPQQEANHAGNSPQQELLSVMTRAFLSDGCPHGCFSNRREQNFRTHRISDLNVSLREPNYLGEVFKSLHTFVFRVGAARPESHPRVPDFVAQHARSRGRERRDAQKHKELPEGNGLPAPAR